MPTTKMSIIDQRPSSSVIPCSLPSAVGEGWIQPAAAAQSQLRAAILRIGMRMEAMKITIAIG